MKPFRWNPEKNSHLKAERRISFEEITLAIAADGLFYIVQHQNQDAYPNQRILVWVREHVRCARPRAGVVTP